jgi:methionyl-tRNA formyltransferase
MLTQETTPIGPDDDAATLHDRLATLGAELLVRTIPGYVAGAIRPRPQPREGVTYARKITKEDGRLDWSRPARELDRRLRAFTPWPGVFTFLPGPGKPVMLKIWRARCVPGESAPPGTVLRADQAGLRVATGEGAWEIHELQREGGRRLPIREFLAGHPVTAGSRLSG